MGDEAAPQIDAWLRNGGLVVAASERAAGALANAYHRARRTEGLTAWPAPNVRNWENFALDAWKARNLDQRLLLSPLQEQLLWAQNVAAGSERAALLEGPLHRVAKLAMEAHRLLCLYAPRFLRPAQRANWQQDAGAFSGWLAAFDEVCRAGGLVSAPRLPLELIEALEAESGSRAPLMLTGFDRILPTQRRLFDAWGEWREAPRNQAATRVLFHQAADESAELAACALWCRRQLAVHSHARLLIVSQDVAKRRGEMERALLRFAGGAANASRLFEFSLGVPLNQVALARGAHLVLRWLNAPIDEHELDWLLSTGQIAADERESHALTAFMRALRRRGLERTRWRFDEFVSQNPREALPAAWVARMTQAKRRLEQMTRGPSTAPQRRDTATPIAWAELVPQLLKIAGWPGGRAPGSAEFQAMRRWRQAVDECASLGFDGRRIEWREFLAALERATGEMLFAPESRDAPILIAGPAESAGLTADAIWFLGATENAWPAGGSAHPLLPLDVQREARMPHATAQLDWELAASVTGRLLASAPEVRFSYARQREGVEARPSRLIVKTAGGPCEIPPELAAPKLPDAQTVLFEDRSRIPFPGCEIHGGSSVLTAQSQCAFKAFATARLGAQQWEPAEAGLSAKQRGQLLHAVLHAVWSGPPKGIRSHAELLGLSDIGAFVEEHVRTVLDEKMPAGARESMPRRYLVLEQTRLAAVVTEWLRYEAARVPFTVAGTELEAEAPIEGLDLKLRLDRVDRLSDGTALVIDYKTGDVSPKSWELPRPDDVQLPLYAGFALDRETEPLGGLVFAKVRVGEHLFEGRMFDAQGQLLRDLSNLSALAKNKLEIEDLENWRVYIEKMARDFVEGCAEVNPREYPETCDRCGLQTLCRVHETQTQPEKDHEDSEKEDDA
ncbi:MAG: PD-(D/E)XK nuclease family protein [Terracidiphilus sp.]